MMEILPRHGGQLHAIAKSLGREASQLLDFSANINPDGPPASVLLSIQQYLLGPEALTLYPDIEEHALRSAVARYTGCEVDNILVSNGFVPLLEAVLQAKAIRSCCVPVPAFNEYRRTVERCGVVMKPVVLDPERNFAYRFSALLAAGCDAILLANPQNPSGVLTGRNELIDFVEQAAVSGVLVLLDEAFIDYARDASLTEDVTRYTNLIVFRSVTKYFGMPGLRVAYAAAHRTVQVAVASCLAPWSISTPAAVGVIAALGDGVFQAAVADENIGRRALFTEALRELGIYVYPAAANYVLARLPGGVNSSVLWRQLVEQYGVVLRLCEDFEGMPAGHLRIAVRTEQQNTVAATALAALLGA